ncbi:uncharacterized protein PAC_17198 [Phialocephala subalpina]|uniref:Sacsin/Nov domain-containing protein n=1 Tax=Phialocephala subalpina TaxID=576137 RepID=A0A1L7XQL3_9HELO|nr:uncharacterized protein PAC_17198 [Phialocephala subalpina]
MANTKPLSREEAREHIQALAKKSMYIDEERFNGLEKDLQDLILQGQKWMESSGRLTDSFTRDVYSDESRFLHEMIQNADDKGFTRAKASCVEPYIQFAISPDSIVVESNQDDFTVDDVDTICEMGNSNKKLEAGKIGEKGMGFKSVFKVAWKVQIESGPYSFFFKYRRDKDPGWYMTTPIYEEPVMSDADAITRITLSLHDSAKSDMSKYFDRLPTKSLLFLRDLKIIKVTDNRQNTSHSNCIWSTDREDKERNSEFLRITEERTDRPMKTHLYHVVRTPVPGMPNHELRQNINQTLVELAFPLDDVHYLPVIEDQAVYAFLPMRNGGFKFLIQADFIMQVNREDIIESEWNNAIRHGVAEAFRDAVVCFSKGGSPEYEKLQYQWMKYLPQAPVSDKFWALLLPGVKEILTETKILKSWNPGPLKYPKELRILMDEDMDEYNNPLLADTPDQIYLSREYQLNGDLDFLKELGVSYQSMPEFVERVQNDLKATTQSRMKSSQATRDWHKRVAKVLLQACLGSNYPNSKAKIRRLPLIPLQGCDDWVSCTEEKVYFPGDSKFPIPPDIGLKLVRFEAFQDAVCKELLSELGVEDCPPQIVIDQIHAQYTDTSQICLSSSIAHTRYLYWNTCGSKNGYKLPSYFSCYNQDGKPVYPSRDDLYFPSQEEYGAQELLRPFVYPSNLEGSAPGYPAHFLHPDYFKDIPHGSDGRSWNSWLAYTAGVRDSFKLDRRGNGKELSPELRYVCDHRPDRIVGMLKRHWPKSTLDLDPEILCALSENYVPTMAGASRPLRSTHLPLPQSAMEIKQLGVEETFGFLKMPVELTNESVKDWEFLRLLKVGMEMNMDFYIDILREHVKRNEDGTVLGMRGIVPDVYNAISEHCITANDRKNLQEVFQTEDLILIPLNSKVMSASGTWTNTDNCVWKGPSGMRTKVVLDSPYTELSHLFRNTLEISDADWNDTLEELLHLERNDFNTDERGRERIEITSRFYSYISRYQLNEKEWSRVRERFEGGKLVYSSSPEGWHPLSRCLWSSTVTIPGKPILSNCYPDFKDFFVKRLKVKKASLETMIEDLKSLAGKRQFASDIKAIILAASSMTPPHSSFQELKGLNILPVKAHNDSEIQLWNTDQDFAIIDRSKLGELFRSALPRTASFLDFDIKDVHSLQPFLLGINLEHRYLSKMVDEDSEVEEGSIDHDQTSKLRGKAYHLLCPKTQNEHDPLYQLLLNAEVHTSDSIISYLKIRQDGQEIRVKSERCNVHITEDQNQLRVFVPRDATNRECSYLKDFPRRMLSILGIGESAETIVTRLLNSSVSLLDYLLEDAGILRVSGVERRTEEITDDSKRPSTSSNLVYGDVNSGQTFGHVQQPAESLAFDRYVERGRQLLTNLGYHTSTPAVNDRGVSSASTLAIRPFASLSSSPSSNARSTSSSSPSRQGSTTSYSDFEDAPTLADSIGTTSYSDVVARIISIAQGPNHIGLPPNGLPDLTHTPESSTNDPESTAEIAGVLSAAFGNRLHNPSAFINNIGAAGELFVYERLKRLHLPNFNIENWQSKIRKLVLPYLREGIVKPWTSKETADIVYKDRQWALTRHLIQQGYPLSKPGNGEGPEYFIEVKSTLGPCKAEFFMIKGQYDRMRKYKITGTQVGSMPSKIYIICRVFNLGKDDTDMHLYFDPGALEENNKLKFTASKYSVVPIRQRNGA